MCVNWRPWPSARAARHTVFVSAYLGRLVFVGALRPVLALQCRRPIDPVSARRPTSVDGVPCPTAFTIGLAHTPAGESATRLERRRPRRTRTVLRHAGRARRARGGNKATAASCRRGCARPGDAADGKTTDRVWEGGGGGGAKPSPRPPCYPGGLSRQPPQIPPTLPPILWAADPPGKGGSVCVCGALSRCLPATLPSITSNSLGAFGLKTNGTECHGRGWRRHPRPRQLLLDFPGSATVCSSCPSPTCRVVCLG